MIKINHQVKSGQDLKQNEDRNDRGVLIPGSTTTDQLSGSWNTFNIGPPVTLGQVLLHQ